MLFGLKLDCALLPVMFGRGKKGGPSFQNQMLIKIEYTVIFKSVSITVFLNFTI